ncbi:MAG TPA: bifunctional nuclease family protein [Acidimicrobiales bacterium]|nr:bifunctional nuclease family protein [Acidimicrobiales bacterium]
MSDADETAADDISDPSEMQTAESEAAVVAPDAQFRVMDAVSVTYDLADASPHVHLMESEAPYRNLSIPIGLADAVALHQAMERVEGRRPGIHELTSQILGRLQADVVAARIVRVDGGVFYAELDLMSPRGREVIDCRTSDAIILALRQRVTSPILCAEDVLADANA